MKPFPGRPGPRNWYRERSLYVEGARLIPIGKRVQQGWRARGHEHRRVDRGCESLPRGTNDFYETEIVRKMHCYGNIIQAFSTYESRNDPDSKPIARGINSIQLLKKDGRWWIVTVMWDNESKDNPDSRGISALPLVIVGQPVPGSEKVIQHGFFRPRFRLPVVPPGHQRRQ